MHKEESWDHLLLHKNLGTILYVPILLLPTIIMLFAIDAHA